MSLYGNFSVHSSDNKILTVFDISWKEAVKMSEVVKDENGTVVQTCTEPVQDDNGTVVTPAVSVFSYSIPCKQASRYSPFEHSFFTNSL